MATRRALTAVDGEPEESEFAHSEITVKGVEYKFVELDAETYDECCELAKREDGTIDTVLLLKVMLPKSLVSPKLGEQKIAKMPMSLRRSLLTEVDLLHFPPIALPAPASPPETPSA